MAIVKLAALGAAGAVIGGNQCGRFIARRRIDVDAHDFGTGTRIGHGGCFAIAPTQTDRARAEHHGNAASQSLGTDGELCIGHDGLG